MLVEVALQTAGLLVTVVAFRASQILELPNRFFEAPILRYKDRLWCPSPMEKSVR